MAVELRCPDCRAKLRLKAAPDPGTDVECPKCGTAFPAPEPEPEPEPQEDAPEDTPEKKPKKKKEKKGKEAAVANAPKRRKAKKRETSKTALIAVISTGVIMLLSVSGVLIWFFTRTSKSVEMMYYVPEESYDAVGMNLGHAQKYPEFYKSLAALHTGTDYKAAGDAIAKASGAADMDALADYMVKAWAGATGSAIVFRTKTEFDEGALAKLPGTEKKSIDGKTYYLTTAFGSGKQRVFAPTTRLVVITPESTKEATFRKMINGHGDAKDNTLGMRMGDLGKRVTRGTFWRMVLFDREMKQYAAPPAPKEGGGAATGDDPKAQWQRQVVEGLNGAKGYGMKASLGSREVRFELIAWHKDSEKSANTARKWKDSELGKGDEGEPPRWFKDRTTGMGDRKVAAQLLSNIGFGASGELFFAKSACETLDLQSGASGAISKVLDLTADGSGGGMGAPTPGGPPGVPGKSPRVRVRPHRTGPHRARRW